MEIDCGLNGISLFRRTTRPIKKVATEQNESGSSDEENDDEDGFEILTAEKLFSTLLQRVRKEGGILG